MIQPQHETRDSRPGDPQWHTATPHEAFLWNAGIQWCPLVGGLVMLAGLVLAGMDAYQWLQTGVWTTRYVVGAWFLSGLAPEVAAWFVTPTSWVGLHRLIGWIDGVPQWVVIVPAGLWIIVSVDLLAERWGWDLHNLRRRV